MSDLEVLVAGERLLATPERALYWPAERALLVADPHWGKAAFFQTYAMAVPEGATQDDLERLTALLCRLGAERLWILGDLVHGKGSWSRDVVTRAQAWRERHAAVDMVLVRGNHDRRGGDPPEQLRLPCVDSLPVGPFLLEHAPSGGRTGAYQLAGHLHPAVRLTGRGQERLTLPCFLFGTGAGVLPAFGTFTGSAVVRLKKDERAFVCTGNAVLEVPRC